MEDIEYLGQYVGGHTGQQVAVVQARPSGVAPPVQVVHPGEVRGSDLGGRDWGGFRWIRTDSGAFRK